MKWMGNDGNGWEGWEWVKRHANKTENPGNKKNMMKILEIK